MKQKTFKLVKLSLLFFGIGFAVFVTGCNDSEEESSDLTLSDYIAQANSPIQRDSLIACAGSGQNGILQDDTGLPVSVIFFPLENISDIRYFETTTLPEDFDDFTQYIERNLSLVPILDGTLLKFAREASTEEVIGFVTFVRNDKLFISNRIHIKDSFEPTIYQPSETEINQSSPLMPAFTWGLSPDNKDAIYFHVVSDRSSNLLSGTYTIENQFQFYKLDNVVLNITPVNETPTLERNEDYLFSVMGISIDNWVNFLSTNEFLTSE